MQTAHIHQEVKVQRKKPYVFTIYCFREVIVHKFYMIGRLSGAVAFPAFWANVVYHILKIQMQKSMLQKVNLG